MANRSVDRACRLMSAFTQHEPALTLSELSRLTELPKATVHRMAATLLARGMLTQRLDGRYELGVKLLELGSIVRENLDVVKLCRPVIDALASSTGETVVVATADWSTREMLLVARRDSPHALAVGSPVGRRMQIPPGAVLGKALLAGLEPHDTEAVVASLELVPTTGKTLTDRSALLRDLSLARARGFASEQDEYIEGASGVAVPVIFEGDHPLAAIGVVGPTSRLAGQVDPVGTLLRELTATLRPGERGRTSS